MKCSVPAALSVTKVGEVGQQVAILLRISENFRQSSHRQQQIMEIMGAENFYFCPPQIPQILYCIFEQKNFQQGKLTFMTSCDGCRKKKFPTRKFFYDRLKFREQFPCPSCTVQSYFAPPCKVSSCTTAHKTSQLHRARPMCRHYFAPPCDTSPA